MKLFIIHNTLRLSSEMAVNVRSYEFFRLGVMCRINFESNSLSVCAKLTVYHFNDRFDNLNVAKSV